MTPLRNRRVRFSSGGDYLEWRFRIGRRYGHGQRAAAVGDSVLRAVRSAVAAEPTDRELLARFTDGGRGGVRGPGQPARRDGARRLPAGAAHRAGRRGRLPGDVPGAGPQGPRPVEWQPSVANWLYATARRVASTGEPRREPRARRESRPVRTGRGVRPRPDDRPRSVRRAWTRSWTGCRPIYREPLVLCYLEGLTRDEAAARLGVPPATLKSQLDRGRKRLGDALTKRRRGAGGRPAGPARPPPRRGRPRRDWSKRSWRRSRASPAQPSPHSPRGLP